MPARTYIIILIHPSYHHHDIILDSGRESSHSWKGSHRLSFVLRLSIFVCICLLNPWPRLWCREAIGNWTCACTHYARWNLSHPSLLSAFLSALMHSVAYRELREHYVARVIRDQAGGPGRCCSQEIIIFISSIPEDPSFDCVLLSLPRLHRHWHEFTSSSGRVMMITGISAGPSNKGYIQLFLYQIILFLVSNFSSMS